MEAINFDNINLFILLIIPGFISIKVYQLLIAVDRINISESIFEVVSYSLMNFALFFWVLIIIDRPFCDSHPFTKYFLLFLIIFITPILLPICYVFLAKSKQLQKYFIHPVKSSWDFLFDQRKPYWVIVHLKSGEKIGGIYSDKSFASSFPRPHEIYLEQVWEISQNNSFIKKEANSEGALILQDEIKFIEFYNTN